MTRPTHPLAIGSAACETRPTHGPPDLADVLQVADDVVTDHLDECGSPTTCDCSIARLARLLGWDLFDTEPVPPSRRPWTPPAGSP